MSVIELGERFEPPPRLVARWAVVIGVQGMGCGNQSRYGEAGPFPRRWLN